MSSHQDPYNYSDPNQNYYESGSGAPVTRQSRSPRQSWPPTATTSNQSGYSQSHQSLDPVGNLLEAHDVEVCACHNFDNATIYPASVSDLQDMNYALNYPPPNDFLPTTSSQGHNVGTYATHINDNTPSNFHYYYPQFDGSYPQHQYGYTPSESVYDYSQQFLAHGAHQMNDGFAVHTPQTSQGPSAPVYPYTSSTQFHSLDHDGAVYQTDARAAQPAAESSTLDVAMVHTARMELPTDGAGQHSHPSPVATSSNQTSTPGPSRPLPSSPERKRLLPLSTDDENFTARRVVPRYDRGASTASDSHRRSRSNSVVHGRGPLIPQERYTTSSISTPEQHPSIPFNLEHQEQIGIPVIDILNKMDSFTRIQNRTQAFSHMGKKTFTLRIQWPGYKPWSKTIAAMDWTKSRAPITRVKLAEAVATGIRDLFEKYRNEAYDPDYVEWNVGPNGIQIDQICLVALHHVSRGSWQPGLCLLTPRR